MADRTAASAFGALFKVMARNPQRFRAPAKELFALAGHYDFSPYQMGVAASLRRLGIAYEGQDEKDEVARVTTQMARSLVAKMLRRNAREGWIDERDYGQDGDLWAIAQHVLGGAIAMPPFQRLESARPASAAPRPGGMAPRAPAPAGGGALPFALGAGAGALLWWAFLRRP